MKVLLNKTFDKKEILILFLDKFFNEIDDVFNFGFEKIKDNYISHCDFLEKKVCIKDANKNIEGIAKSINNDGSLNLDINNNIIVIRNGDLLC
jgi:biotin-(acetyl-CoA carboxylase) ligase